MSSTLKEDFTELERFNINITHIIPAIISVNKKLYEMKLCDTNHITTSIALHTLIQDINIDNIINTYKSWDSIISGNFSDVLTCISYFENKYPIKLTFIKEIFFTSNIEITKIRDRLFENIISIISICCSYILSNRNPLYQDNCIIYTSSYHDNINIEKYLY